MYSLIPIIIQCSTYYHNIAEEKERREQEKEKVRAAKKEEANVRFDLLLSRRDDTAYNVLQIMTTMFKDCQRIQPTQKIK